MNKHRYLAIADQIAEQIEQGIFRMGERLPALRQMANQQQASISTIQQAYGVLEDRQLIHAKPQSGYYVAQNRWRKPEPPPISRAQQPAVLNMQQVMQQLLDHTHSPDLVHLGAALPADEFLPINELQKLAGQIARQQMAEALRPVFSPGNDQLRRQIAMRMIHAGVQMSPEQILITNGCQEALMLTLQAHTQPGDIVAVESPCYYGVLQLLEMLGLKALLVPTDPQHGIDVDALEQAVQQWPIDVCICAPCFNNPTGGAMQEADKQALVSLANRYRLTLIEDDIFGELCFQEPRPKALKAYDTEGRVIYCSSFSKIVSPGLRVGWLAMDQPLDPLRARQTAGTMAIASLSQLLMARYLENGGLDRHLRQVRRSYADNIGRAQQSIARHFPDGTRASQPSGGFLLWVSLPNGCNALEVHQKALQQGISIVPGQVFAPRGFDNCLRLSCSLPWSQALEQTLATLGQICCEQSAR